MMSDMESLLKSQGIVFDRSKMSVHIVYSIDKALSDFWQAGKLDISFLFVEINLWFSFFFFCQIARNQNYLYYYLKIFKKYV